MPERLDYYRQMLRIRLFEEKLLSLFREGKLRGTAHVCLGQEAVAVGVSAGLKAGDYVSSNHRGHGHMLARGADINKIMAELFGKESGYSLGRGGSQHISAMDVGFLGSNGITGGGIPIATGASLAARLKNDGRVALSFFGDGASAQGTFHESLNMAALWKLPVIFLCENNHYAMGTHVRHTCPTERLSDRAKGYGVKGMTVDGNDVVAMAAAVADARKACAEGDGPYFIEAITYRAAGHSRSDMCGYRPDEEEELWLDRDPVKLMRQILLDEKLAAESEVAGIEAEVEAEIADAVKFAEQSEHLPVEKACSLVYPETFAPVPENSAGESGVVETTYADALYRALARAMADPSVFLMGEDIADYLGAFRVTKDLYERFGSERVRNTPISENSIVGLGVGAAMTGMRPVVEIMFMDFMLLALDQIVNHAAKFSYIFGGQAKVPLTVRTPAGGRRGYGATHSQCFETLLMSIPGIKIFCPATVQDAYDLLLAAIFDDSPVVMVEHKLLYGTAGELNLSAKPLEPGKARIVREGGDLTIVTFSHMLTLAMQAAEYLSGEGVEAEVIDLRTLEPLDFDTVADSANRTQRVVIAEEGVMRGGVGAEIAARLQDECFGYLDAPIVRVGAKSCPIPTVEHLEKEVLPQVEDIILAARKTLL